MTAATVEAVVERFLEHKRTLGRKYDSEQNELRLFVRFMEQRGVTALDRASPALLEDFLASRPRTQIGRAHV